MATAFEGSPISMDRITGFTVDAAFDAPRMTLAPRGELDLASVESFDREVEALPWPELEELVFDLADLTFIDSTGLSALIRASQRALTAGLDFSVIRVPDQPLKLFKIAGVTESLNVRR